MTTVWAPRHEDLVSHDGVSSHVCDPMVVPHCWAGLDRGNPSGSAGDACRDAAAQARRAARAVDGGVVSVPQALSVSPSTPPIHAQRVAQFDHYCTRTPCHQRNDVEAYSRYNFFLLNHFHGVRLPTLQAISLRVSNGKARGTYSPCGHGNHSILHCEPGMYTCA